MRAHVLGGMTRTAHGKCLCWRALGGPRPRVTVTPTRASRAPRRGLGRHQELVLLGRSPKGHLGHYLASSDSRTQLRTVRSETDPHPIRLDTVRLRGKRACAAPKIRSALVLTSFSFSRFPHFRNSCGGDLSQTTNAMVIKGLLVKAACLL